MKHLQQEVERYQSEFMKRNLSLQHIAIQTLPDPDVIALK